MTPIYKSGTIILWGTVTQEPKLRETKSGRSYASFGMKYDRHHNEDGQMVNEYMNVTMWGDDAKFIGDESIGLGKGDTILVCGQLVEDTYRKEGEDPNVQKWKVNADIVIDMTSIFQVAQMVVDGDVPAHNEPAASAPSKPKFTDTEEKTPFQQDVDDADGELPF